MSSDGEIKHWRRIDCRIIPSPRHLCNEDKCFHYLDYYGHGGYKRSRANQLVFNLKAEPTEIVDHPNRQWYKAEAIGQFISDALIFFKRLFEQKPSLTVLLVPVPPSASRSDPNYDDRLVQVVNNLANSCSNITADDILAFDETQQPSHIGGSRNPDELLKSLRFVGPTGTPPDVIFVLDDVISSGAHYHACKTLLSRHYSDSQIAGLFWAKTIPESVTYHYFPDIQ